MRSFKLLTVIAALGAATALALGLGVTAAQSESPVNTKHFFWSQNQSTPTPDQLASDIIYHGGNAGPGAVGVLTKPYAYLIWWGTEWKDGFSFGNGIFDSWSIVVGHEYEEAVTDPDNFFAVQDGWNDAQTSENSDKCAWTKLKNAKLGSHLFAVQPNWSNVDFDAGGDGCPTPY